MTRTVRTVVIGTGFGRRAVLPALRYAGGVEVVGLAGHDADKARRVASEAGVPLGTGDWRELCELEPDLAIVTSPVDLHHPMVCELLERTKAAILCEKPFALDVSQAQDLVQRAEGRAAWIDHELRWSPHLRELRRRCFEGLIGEPLHLRAHMHLPTAGFRDKPFGWWFQAERGGGVLGALGSHLVDLCRWIGGEIDAARGSLQVVVPQRQDAEGALHEVSADEHALCELRFAGSARGEVITSGNETTPLPPSIGRTLKSLPPRSG